MSHFISFVRIPALAIRQHLRPLPPLGVLDEDRLSMRVWPNDIDFNLHLNNARYLSMMDYGRMHLLARTRILEHVIRSRWTPLVGAVWMTYRRSLPLFARFTLSSRTVCWDERWFYMEQTTRSSEGLASTAWVKALFQDRGKNVPPQVIVDMVQPRLVSPAFSESMLKWNELTREKLNKK